MSLDTLKSLLPDYAKDLKLNLGALAHDITLTPQQLAGTFVASAIASRNPLVTELLSTHFADALSTEALDAARAVVATLGLNILYSRFVAMAGGAYA